MRPISGKPVDVVVVCTASTPGNRRSDLELVAALRDLGVSVVVASTDYGIVGKVRKSQNLIDVTRALSNRLSVSRALCTIAPSAFIYGTAGAALLEPSARLERAGIRFDALAVDNRPGYRHAGQRLLERRMVADAALLLPFGSSPTWPQIACNHKQAPISLPTPVDPFGPGADTREPAVVCLRRRPGQEALGSSDPRVGNGGTAGTVLPCGDRDHLPRWSQVASPSEGAGAEAGDVDGAPDGDSVPHAHVKGCDLPFIISLRGLWYRTTRGVGRWGDAGDDTIGGALRGALARPFARSQTDLR